MPSIAPLLFGCCPSAFRLRRLALWAGLFGALVIPALDASAARRQGAGRKVYIAATWRGENLVGGTGVTTLTINPVTASRRAPVLTSQPVQLYLRRVGSNAFTLLRYPFLDSFSRSLPLWKLPAGRYQLIKVVAQSTTGRRWVWQVPAGKKAPVLAVAPGVLATWGQWRIMAGSKGRLSVQLVGKGGVAFDKRAKAKIMRLGGIMNGLTGKMLTKKRRISKKASRAQGKAKNKVLGVFSRTKNIGVFYGIALSNYKAQTTRMTKLLRRNDLGFRNCYLKTLRFDGRVAGKLVYRFQVSPSDRLIEPTIARGSTVKDKRLLRCLYYEISSLKVPMKLPLKGSIAFKFMTSR